MESHANFIRILEIIGGRTKRIFTFFWLFNHTSGGMHNQNFVPHEHEPYFPWIKMVQSEYCYYFM